MNNTDLIMKKEAKISLHKILAVLAFLASSALAALTEGTDYTLNANCELTIKTKDAFVSRYAIDVGSCTDLTYKLGVDLDFGATDSTCATSWLNSYDPIIQGSLDGDGHTISGLCLKSTASSAYFFVPTEKTKFIKNITFSNVFIKNNYTGTSNTYTGLFATISNPISFENVTLDNIVVSHGSNIYTGSYMGLITATTHAETSLKNVEATNILVQGETYYGYVGGLIGIANASLTIANTTFQGNTTFKYATGGSSYVGGLVGIHTKGTLNIKSTQVLGETFGSAKTKAYSKIVTYVGGVAGFTTGDEAIIDSVSIKIGPDSKSYAYAVQGGSDSLSYVGGFIGFTTAKTTIKNGSNVKSPLGFYYWPSLPTNTHLSYFIGDVGGTNPIDIENSYFIANQTISGINLGLFSPVINSIKNSYAIATSPDPNTYGMSINSSIKSNSYVGGEGRLDHIEIFKDSVLVGSFKPQSPALANILQTYTYDPNKNNGYPEYTADPSKRTYKLTVLAKEDSSVIHEFYSDTTGRMTYGSDGKTISTSLYTKKVKELLAKIYSKNDTSFILRSEMETVIAEDFEIEADYIVLKTPWALRNIQKIIVGNEGKELRLGADIDLGGKNSEDCSVNWDPEDAVIQGIFDGQGHTISGICYKKEGNYTDSASIFNIVGSAEIKNLNFADIYVKSTVDYYFTNVGLFNVSCASNCDVSFKNMKMDNVTIGLYAYSGYAGLLIGNGNKVPSIAIDSIETKNISIVVDERLHSGNHYIGGLIGRSNNLKMKHSSLQGSITLYHKGHSQDIGGISGQTYGENVIENSKFDLNIIGRLIENFHGSDSFIGGLFGRNRGATFDINNVTVSGIIDLESSLSMSRVGGFIGTSSNETNIKNSKFIGKIRLKGSFFGGSEEPFVGGLVGSGAINVDNTIVSSPSGDPSEPIIEVSSDQTLMHVGGIDSDGAANITNTSVTGTIVITPGERAGTRYLGGMAGSHSRGVISNSKFHGQLIVQSDETMWSCQYLGGIAGYSLGELTNDTIVGATNSYGQNILINTKFHPVYDNFIGGAVAYFYGDTVKNVSVNGDIIIDALPNASASIHAGRVIGYSNSYSSIQEVTTKGFANISTKDLNKLNIGGNIGISKNGNYVYNSNVLADENKPLFYISSTAKTINVGGITGEVNCTSCSLPIRGETLVEGDIIINSAETQANIGGLVGSATNASGVIDSTVYKGKIIYTPSVATLNETNIGGLVGTNAGSAFTILNSHAVGEKELNSDALLQAIPKGNDAIYMGGLVGNGFVSTIVNSYAKGVIRAGTSAISPMPGLKAAPKAPTPIEGNVYAGGLAGSATGNGNFYKSFFIGSLPAGTTQGAVYGLLAAGNGRFNNVYALDFSGTANAIVPSTANLGINASANASEEEIAVNYGNTKLAQAKQQTDDFGLLMRGFKRMPGVNDDYPLPTTDIHAVWVEDEHVLTSVQVIDGTAYFANGNSVNSRLISKLPKTEKFIKDGKVTYIFWSNYKKGKNVGQSEMVWREKQYDKIFNGLTETVVFFKDTLVFDIPKFYQNDRATLVKNDDENRTYWNGEDFSFDKSIDMPMVVFQNNTWTEEFFRNTYWNMTLENASGISTNATPKFSSVEDFWDFLPSVYNHAVTTNNLSTDEFSVKMVLPSKTVKSNFEAYATSLNYTKMKTQDIEVTIDSINIKATFNLTNNKSLQNIKLPRASSIKFNNNADFSMRNYDGYNTTISCKANELVSMPDSFTSIGVYPNMSYEIIVDLTGTEVYKPIFMNFDYPTSYEGDPNGAIEFPELASLAGCFTGWEITYIDENGLETTPTQITRHPILDNFFINWKSTYSGPIKAKPVFDGTPCNKTLELVYTNDLNSPTPVTPVPENLTWNVSRDGYNFTVNKVGDIHEVVVPLHFGVDVEVHSDKDALLHESFGTLGNIAISSELNHGSTIGNNTMGHSVYAVIFGDNSSTEIARWVDLDGVEFMKMAKQGDFYSKVLEDGSISTLTEADLPVTHFRKDGKMYVYQNENGNYWNRSSIEKGTYKPVEFNFGNSLKFFIAQSSSLAEEVGKFQNIKDVYVSKFDIMDTLLPTVAARFKTGDKHYYATNYWEFVFSGTIFATTSVDELIDRVLREPARLSQEGGIKPYVNVGTLTYQDPTELSYVIACNINSSCEKRNYTTIVKTTATEESVDFTGYVLGKSYKFDVEDNTFIPLLDSLTFGSTVIDSMIIVQSNEMDEQISMDFVAPKTMYRIPHPYAELNLMLKVSTASASLHKLNVIRPDVDGTLFRTFQIPTTYYSGTEVLLPKLATLNTCSIEYEVLDENNAVDKFADIRENENGDFIWSSSVTSGDVSIRAVEVAGSCDLTPNKLEVTKNNADVVVKHFEIILPSENENDKTFYKFPANGRWPAIISAMPKPNYAIKEIKYNGQDIKNDGDIIVSDNGILVIQADTINGDNSEFKDMYRIAETQVLQSGTAMRMRITTADFNVKEPVSLSVKLYKAGSLYLDTLLTKSANNNKYTFDYFTLPEGSYYAEAILSGSNGDVTKPTDAWEIQNNSTIIKGGTWVMKSLANITDEFQIPQNGDGAVYYWDEEKAFGDYKQYRKLKSVDKIEDNRGYWYINEKDTEIKRTLAPAASDSLHWNLKNSFSGWNMVANPYSWTLQLDSIDFRNPEDTSTGFWRWNSSALSYEQVDTIAAYDGFWVFADKNEEMSIANKPHFTAVDKSSNAPKSSFKKATVNQVDSWSLQLGLTGENGLSDLWNVVGVGSREVKVDNPPAAIYGGVSLSIENGNRSLSKSIKKSLNDANWNINFSAANLQSGKLYIDGIENLETLGLYASIELDGRVIPVNAGDSIPLNLSTVNKTAVLKVSANPAIQYANGITNLKYKANGNSLNVNFNLAETSSSKVEVQLVDIQGHVIASANESAEPGNHSLTLDKPTTSGIYILRVFAGHDKKQLKIKL